VTDIHFITKRQLKCDITILLSNVIDSWELLGWTRVGSG